MFGTQKTAQIRIEGKGVYSLSKTFRTYSFAFFRDADANICTDQDAPYIYLKATVSSMANSVSLDIEGRYLRHLKSLQSIGQTEPFQFFDKLERAQKTKHLTLQQAFNVMSEWESICFKNWPRYNSAHEQRKDRKILSTIQLQSDIGIYPQKTLQEAAKQPTRFQPKKLSI